MGKNTHIDIHKTRGLGRLHIPDGKRERLPEPECLFYRSVQRKDSGKNQASTIL
jgi:hypothetical protein